MPVQIEGADGGDQHPLGSEYYTTLRSEADNDVNAATVASEEAEAEINRCDMLHYVTAQHVAASHLMGGVQCGLLLRVTALALTP